MNAVPLSRPQSGFEGLRGTLREHLPLAPFTSWRVGGPALRYYQPADRDDLITFVRQLPAAEPVLWLGLGSNLLVRDGGWPGTVIHLHGALDRLSVPATGDGAPVVAEAGVHCARLAKQVRAGALAGLGFMAGIPGTVGGFVRMNGGAYGREVSDVLIDCDVILPGGRLVTLPAADLRYTYRHSALPDAAVVVRARFQGEPGDPATIGAKMDEIGEHLGREMTAEIFEVNTSTHYGRMVRVDDDTVILFGDMNEVMEYI